MYKILQNVRKKYAEGIESVDTVEFHRFAVAMTKLSHMFLPIGRGKLRFKPQIIEK